MIQRPIAVHAPVVHVDPRFRAGSPVFHQLSSLLLHVVDKQGFVIISPQSGITYMRVMLQGRVVTGSAKTQATLFHCSNIVDQAIDPVKGGQVSFNITIPDKANLEMTPMRQREWENAMSDYMAYKKRGAVVRSKTKIQESHNDEIYNYLVESKIECQHNQILPTYEQFSTGSRVEYEIVAKGYIGNKYTTATSRICIKPDLSFPSACLRTGVDPYGYFGLTDSLDDRLCVMKNNVCAPIPKPLRIGKLNFIKLFGANSKTKVTLQAYEYTRNDCSCPDYLGLLVRSDVLYSGKVKNELVPLTLPQDIAPSFSHCKLRVDYKLLIETESGSLQVPVGVNYTGREGP